MTHHELKSWPEFFALVLDGTKSFELRKDDRNFQVGDMITMREWEPSNGGKYSGREITKRISYILKATGPGGITPYRGLVAGYSILQLTEP